jgi:hypothetical protein
MARQKKPGDPFFLVKLEKGLADRKRLPLGHVLGILDELRQLVIEIGRDAQRRRGVSDPTDFGLELVAGEKGVAFRPGSVQAQIAITERADDAFTALASIIGTVDLLGKDNFLEVSADKQFDRRIIRRLSRIAKIQKRDHTEMELSARRAGVTQFSATFGAAGMAVVRSLQAPTFKVENTVLFGKLFQLTDRDPSDFYDEKGFWGELRLDNGEVWRIQFDATDAERVGGMFRKQVKVTGAAFYYRIAHPKLVCSSIDLDRERDPEAAFDEFYGCDRGIYKTDLQTLLRTIHGEE